ncbi:MAG: AsmA family protein [Alphaproteobacteria bacterium]|jgi:uncharacterized protein involved in outer membrane biogenesis|nr:AsmA family protein [Alphaproteobacteria bacterium]
MKKLLKRLSAGLVVLFLLLGAGLALAPYVVEPNAYKEDIRDQVAAATGRPLFIDGDISIALLPVPRLRIAGLRFPDDTGAGAEGQAMATVEAIEARLDWLPLLTGTVRLAEVMLRKPRLRLERRVDGGANWEMRLGQTDAGEVTLPTVAMPRLRVEDGSIRYVDAAAGIDERVEALEATLAAQDLLHGPYQIEAKATRRRQPLTLAAALGRRTARGPLPLEARLEGLSVRLDLEGELAAPIASGEFRLSVRAQAAEPARTMAALGQTLPPGLSGPLNLSAEVRRVGQAIRAEPLALTAGPTRVEGGVVLTLAEKPDLRVRLDIGEIALEPLLAVVGRSEAGRPGTGPSDVPRLTLPENLSLQLRLGLEALTWKGEAVRDAALQARLADARLKIEDFRARLPGDGRIRLSGALETTAGKPRFAGELNGELRDTAALLGWLGVPLAGVEKGRLGRSSIEAVVEVTSDKVAATALAMRLDETTLSGTVTVGLGPRPDAEIDLVVDRIDLDSYRGEVGGRNADVEAPPTTAPAGLLATLAPLASFDGAIRLAVGEVVHNRQRIVGARLAARLADGTLTLHELGADDLAGASLAFDGRLSGIGGTPSFDLNYAIKASEAHGLISLIEPEVAGEAGEWGAVEITGAARGDEALVELKTAARLAGVVASLEGNVGLTAGAPVDIALDLEADQPRRLLGLLGLASPVDLGRIELRLDAKGNAEAAKVTGAASLLGGRAMLAGELKGIAEEPEVRLRLTAEHPRAYDLLQVLAPDYRPAAGVELGALHLAADIAGGADRLTFRELDLRLGDSALSGSASIAAAARQAELRLRVARLDLDAVLPKRQTDAPVAPGPVAEGAGFALPADLGLELDLSAAEIGWRGEKVRDLVVKAALQQGIVTFERLSALLPAETRIALDGASRPGDGGPRFSGNMELASANLARLLTWLGAAPAGLPADRLGGLMLTSRVEGDASEIVLDELAARLDDSEAKGRISLGFGPRPRLDAELAVDGLDVDGYLPRPPAGAEKGEEAAAVTDVDGLLAQLAPLAEVDGSLKLTLGRAVLRGQRLTGAELALALEAGDLRVSKLAVDDLAGARLAVSGALMGLGGTPAFELSYELEAAEAQGLVALFDAGAKAPSEGYGAIRIAGRGRGDGDGVELDGEAAFVGATAALGARVGFQPGAPVTLDAELEAPDPGRLLALVGAPPVAASGPLTAVVKAKGVAEKAAFEAELRFGQARLDLDGGIETVEGQPRLDAAFDAGHPRLASLLQSFGVDLSRGDEGRLGALRLTGHVQAKAGGLVLGRLAGGIAAARISEGKVVFSASPTEGHSASLRLDRLDLDPILTAFAGGGSVEGETGTMPAFALPEALKAGLDLRVATLRWQNRELSGVAVEAELEAGRLHLRKAVSRLPGNGRVSLSGVVTAAKAAPVFEGRLSLDQKDLRPLLKWAEVAPPRVGKERLRRLVASSAVRADAESLALSDLKLRLDDSTLTGKLLFRPGPRPWIGGELRLDGIALDDYVPEASSGKGPKASPLAPLAGLDGELGLRAGEIVWQGRSVRDVWTRLALRAGQLEIQELRIGNLGGGVLEAGGKIRDLAGKPRFELGYSLNVKAVGGLVRFLDPARPPPRPAIGPLALSGSAQGGLAAVDWRARLSIGQARAELDGSLAGLDGTPSYGLNYDLEAPDAGPLFALAAVTPPLPPAKLGAVRAAGRIDGSAARIAIDTTIAALGANAVVKGTAGLAAGAPVVLEAQLDADDAAPMLALAGASPPADLGAVSVRLKAEGTAAQARFEASGRLAGGEVTADGVLRGLDSAPDYDLRFSAAHPELYRLIRTVQADYVAAGGSRLGAVRAAGQVTGGADGLAVSALDLAFGESRVGGDLRLHFDSVRPRLIAGLNAGRLDLRPLLPAEGRGRQGRSDRVFSREPLPFDRLQAVDAKIKLRAKELLTADLALRDVTVDAILEGGRLVVEPFDARVGGGVLTGALQVATKPDAAPTMVTQLRVDKLDLATMLRDLGEKGGMRGKLDGMIDLQGQGRSVAELMAGLNGHTSLVVGRGRIDNQYIDLIGADLSGNPLDLLNPLAAKERYTEVNCAVGRFNVAGGLARIQDMVFDTTRMTVVGEGEVNLRNEALRIGLKPSPKGPVGDQLAGRLGLSLGNLVRPFKLGGTLVRPRLAIDPAASAILLSRALGGAVLRGPAGIAAALLTPSGTGNPCLEAIEAAKTGVRAPAGRQEPAAKEPDATIPRLPSPGDILNKPAEKTVEDLQKKLLEQLLRRK